MIESTWQRISENGIELLLEITADGDVRLLHFGTGEPEDVAQWPDKIRAKYRLIEVHASGENHNDHHGSKHTGTLPGGRLKLIGTEDRRNASGRWITWQLEDRQTGLTAHYHLQFYDRIQVVRTWTELANSSTETIGLEYVSTFALYGIDREGMGDRGEKMRLHIPHNTWYGEAQWRQYSLPELGLEQVNAFSMKRLSYASTGTWSSSQYAPMGFLENAEAGTGLVWQIEHNGSWHWEISDMADQLYLQLSGPTEAENHWWKTLAPGETFVTVPAAIGVVKGGVEKAIAEMTRYRRAIRRPNADNVRLPVIFNDYMNCLFGDPTTEKLLPLIDAAAAAGCEYYCVDCGWYSDGEWWDGVGEWLPSEARFPGGIGEVMQYIRDKGMIGGLWLEIEVMGTQCKLASEVPDDWFFLRHGKRVIDHARYQLDFRNPDVRAYADKVIDRVVGEYGAGYIKMDYNINAGIGTDHEADSAGDGLLDHNRAYLGWLDGVFARYPDLVIENCGSGGMRIDYALLSRHSIQSTSDQTDYAKNAVIAAASASLVTPEQAAVWSYPLREGDEEEVIVNMVNSLLLRIHQSGHLAEISSERLALVQEAIAYYKEIRGHIREGLPFWPLGLPNFESPWLSFGIRNNSTWLLAVWRMDDSEETCKIPIPALRHLPIQARMAYPSNADEAWSWDASQGALTVTLPKTRMARLFEFQVQ
ncbi:alpha-galactosidase [Paenibacillus phyllosphaerae]|uniref:Alpha-galactosidase n=1 Tax=Paenibacillus phyllosphaerae TaxID=274593 RepID=A0A7W5B4Y2_9BACL|nr:glycoside hydrolase family 36 protein [Paenibacillus phyllosphaerae]MBB3114500.1 alpha-galactosidase [Paenibacillus phyllosphaerae]